MWVLTRRRLATGGLCREEKPTCHWAFRLDDETEKHRIQGIFPLSLQRLEGERMLICEINVEEEAVAQATLGENTYFFFRMPEIVDYSKSASAAPTA